MSASAPVLAPAVGPRGAQTGADNAGTSAARPLVRIGAFAGLALFGALRWGELMAPAPTGRLLGLVAIAVALVAAGPWTAQRSRAAAILLAGLAALGMLLVCGLPWSWLWHERIAVSGRAIGTGLDALPRLLVPYHGVNPWVRMVLLLGRGAADLRRGADARLRRSSPRRPALGGSPVLATRPGISAERSPRCP